MTTIWQINATELAAGILANKDWKVQKVFTFGQFNFPGVSHYRTHKTLA